MSDIDRTLTTLRKLSERLSKLDSDRESLMRQRDDALRAAQAAKATYLQMQEASGLSAVTVSKALRRR